MVAFNTGLLNPLYITVINNTVIMWLPLKKTIKTQANYFMLKRKLNFESGIDDQRICFYIFYILTSLIY